MFGCRGCAERRKRLAAITRRLIRRAAPRPQQQTVSIVWPDPALDSGDGPIVSVPILPVEALNPRVVKHAPLLDDRRRIEPFVSS